MNSAQQIFTLVAKAVAATNLSNFLKFNGKFVYDHMFSK